ncbi:beta strand repeat-containing protein [Shewanella sp. TC10]|uniref:beta strand repeat-containing protein n=1 Tax=Shewanella sp. TC10 TaxID=1419739 RepID=UPI001E377803|nr:Ig-like domain-containing protein [Shewanella sp. TC10]
MYVITGTNTNVTATLTIEVTPVADGAPGVIINTDTNNDVIISEEELAGNTEVSVTIDLTTTGAQPGDTLVVNGQEIILTQEDIDNGSIDLTLPAPAEGETIEVVATIIDSAGNISPEGSDSALLDTVAPVITVVAPDNTNDNTPTITGSTDAEPGSTVTIVVTDNEGNEQVLEAIVDEDGNYQVDVEQPLAEGDYTVVAEVTDPAGNTATDNDDGQIDTIAPVITVNAPDNNVDTTPTITGTTDATPGSTVTLTITDNEGNEQVLEAIVNPDGSYEVDVAEPLAEGEYNVVAVVTDPAGNTASANDTGDIDTTAPEITVSAPDNSADATPTITGTTDAEPGSTVTIIVTDSAGQEQIIETLVNPDGTYSVEVPLPLAEGDYTAVAGVSDSAGNGAFAEDNGDIDLTPPTITVSTPDDASDNTPLITGTTDATPGSTVTLVVTDSNGVEQTIEAIVEPDGSYQVEVPNELSEGDYSVIAEVTDPAGNTATANDTGEIDALFAFNDSNTVAEDSVASGNVLDNDDSDNTEVVSFTLAGDSTVYTPGSAITVEGGSLLISSTGAYSFTPASDWNGVLPVITYTTDTGETATLTITVGEDNTDTTNDAISVAEDTVASGNVLSNDESDNTEVVSFTLAGDSTVYTPGSAITVEGGSLLISSTGAYSFTPASDWNGVLPVITYTTDTGETATLTITVGEDNTDTTNDAISVAEDTVASGNVLSNDESDNTEVVSFTLAGDSTVYTPGSAITVEGGSLLISSTGAYSFTPASDWNGVLPVITYTTDTGETATLTINVAPQNDDPDAQDNSYLLNDGQAISGNLINDNTGSGFDSDIEGDALTITHINGVELVFTANEAIIAIDGGTLTINSNGNFTFVHDDITTNIPSFEYTITDGNGGSDSATVTLSYNDIDAVDDLVGSIFSTTADSANNWVSPVNSDGEADFVISARNADGTVGVVSSGDNNLLGVSGSPRTTGQIADQIEYDSTTGTSEAIVIDFNGLVNEATFSVSHMYANENSGEQGTWYAYYNGQLVATQTFTTSTGTTGTFTINTGNQVFDQLVFEAAPTISEANGGAALEDSSDYYLDSVTVTGPALVDAYVVQEDSTLEITDEADGLFANDTDAQNHDFDITHVNGVEYIYGQQITLASGATIIINDDGTYTYDVNGAFDSLTAGELDTDTFTYTLTDEYDAVDTATVTINIVGVNLAPEPNTDQLIVLEGESITFNAIDLISNDNDPESDSLSVTRFSPGNSDVDSINASQAGQSFTTTLGGTITINNDGSYSYQAPQNLDHTSNDTLNDSFYYQVSDGTSESSWTQVLIDVNDTAPVAQNDLDSVGFGGSAYGSVITGAGTDGSGVDDIGADVTELTSIRIAGTTYDTFDADGNIVVTIANRGTITINKDGSYNFVSSVPEVNGQQSVASNIFYTLTDSDGDSTEARLRIVQDSSPAVNDDVTSASESGLLGGTTEGNDSNITTGNLLDNDEGISGSTEITQVNGITPVNGIITVTTAIGELTVYTEDTADNRAGDYEYTLNTSTNGDNVSESFSYEVLNALNSSDSGSLTVNIVDDSPVVEDITQNLQTNAETLSTNLTFILDVSGSMDNSAGNGKTYLETAIESLTALINEVDASGNVNIQIVTYSSSATNSSWIIDDIDGAIAYLNSLQAGGGTNYEAALGNVINSGAIPDADKNFVYFISDGVPSSGNEVDATLQGQWQTYLDSNYDISFGIGIGNASLDAILPIAYPEADDGSEEYAIIVNDADDLTNTILDFFDSNTVTGSLGIISNSASGVLVGADGGHVQSIVVDGITYTYDASNPTKVITTNLGATFEINFSTGEYEYLLDASANVLNEQESIDVTIIDNDGDSASLVLQINLDYYASLDANVNNVITNQAQGDLTISTEYLTHGDALPDNGSLSSVTTGSASNTSLANDTVTITNVNDGDSFEYTLSANGTTDTAEVTVDYQNSDILIGTHENDIIIASSTANNTVSATNIKATVKSGNTYNASNQFGFEAALLAAGISITRIDINLRGGGDTNAIVDVSQSNLVKGSDSVGIDDSNTNIFANMTQDSGTLTAVFSAGDFTNGDEFWFAFDTDNLGNDTGASLVGATFTVTLSDGTVQTGTYISDGANGATGNIYFADAILDGGAGDDVLIGGDGNEILIGGLGDDLLSGGLGDDVMTGGEGNNTFVWNANEIGTDTITDFDTSKDSLDLRDLLVNEDLGSLDSMLNFSTDGNSTTIDIDADNNGVFEQHIVLDGVDLTDVYGSTDDGVIINGLLDDGALIVDGADASPAQNVAAVDPLENVQDGNIIP